MTPTINQLLTTSSTGSLFVTLLLLDATFSLCHIKFAEICIVCGCSADETARNEDGFS